MSYPLEEDYKWHPPAQPPIDPPYKSAVAIKRGEQSEEAAGTSREAETGTTSAETSNAE